MYLADALSRAYPKNSTPLVTPPSEFSLAELQLAEHLVDAHGLYYQCQPNY